MSDALDLWREKLAGVTPLVERARAYLDTEASLHNPAASMFILRLVESFERPLRLSRILADEASVEGLARVLCKASVEHGQAEGVEAHPDHVELNWPAYVSRAVAVLNHLAQLALGDG